jgi:hypothetical protein
MSRYLGALNHTDAPIYRGIWINHEFGLARGLTLTTSTNGTAFLIAFLALFVSVVGAQFWAILRFLLHQYGSTDRIHSLKYYQQQVVLRNDTSALHAAWDLIRVGRKWRQVKAASGLRDVYLPLLAVLSIISFGIAGVFSSQISKAASPTFLLDGKACSAFTPRSKMDLDNFELDSVRAHTFLDASIFVRACYNKDNAAVDCGQSMIDKIPSTVSTVPCPFDSSLCLEKTAFRLDTGLIDSHTMLGFNSHLIDRLYFRKVAECSSLNISNHLTVWNGTDNSISVADLYLGAVGDKNVTTRHVQTYVEKTMNYQYTVKGGNSVVFGGVWEPIPGLVRNDSALSVIALSLNDLLFFEPSDDPFFPIHQEFTIPASEVEDNVVRNISLKLYGKDSPITALGCLDQFQICKNSAHCTALNSGEDFGDVLENLSSMQKILFSVFKRAAAEMYISNPIIYRENRMLNAEDYVSSNFAGKIAKNQRHVEIQYWFDTTSALLQRSIAIFGYLGASITFSRLSTEEKGVLCPTIMIRSNGGYQNFSVVGMIIVFVLGGLIIAVGWNIETFSERVFGWPARTTRASQWWYDGAFQLQRAQFERAEIGPWSDMDEFVPTSNPLIALEEEEYVNLLARRIKTDKEDK